MSKEEDMYKLVCQEKFKELKDMQAETLRILKGDNSRPGMCDDVRGLKKAYKRIIGGGIFILAAIFVQAIRLLSEWISGIFN